MTTATQSRHVARRVSAAREEFDSFSSTCHIFESRRGLLLQLDTAGCCRRPTRRPTQLAFPRRPHSTPPRATHTHHTRTLCAPKFHTRRLHTHASRPTCSQTLLGAVATPHAVPHSSPTHTCTDRLPDHAWLPSTTHTHAVCFRLRCPQTGDCRLLLKSRASRVCTVT